MKLKFTLLAAFTLSGCAALVGGNFEYLQGTTDYQQCAYQAKSSTPPSQNVFEDVMREKQLTNMCLAAKGYKSR